MRKQNLFVYSKKDFNKTVSEMGITDDNVENLSKVYNIVFISICCTKDCIDGWIHRRNPHENDDHYFKKEHDCVLNLDFDDIPTESFEEEWNGNKYTYRCISDAQADQIIDFVNKHSDKNIYLHCRAGISRSQAVAAAIIDMHKEVKWCKRDLKNPLSRMKMNQLVYKTIWRRYEERSNGIDKDTAK